MILLDTNVLSELMKSAPAGVVIEWVNAQSSHDLHVSTVTIGEIEYGLRILPDGRRRDDLRARFETFVERAFSDRVLSYDAEAARAYGDIMGVRKEMGRPMSVPDGQIAAIARSQTLTVASRNTRDFDGCGVELVNPFVEGV